MLLLAHNANITAVDNRGRNALEIAIEKGNTQIARLLLEAGLKIEDISDDDKVSLAKLALKNRHSKDIFDRVKPHIQSMQSLLSNTQADLLNDMIGRDKDGDYGYIFASIVENKLLASVQILYLRKAVTQDYQSFNTDIDKLYNQLLSINHPYYIVPKSEVIEFIKSLKIINDICFNNQGKYNESGIKTALDFFFGSVSSDICPYAFQLATQEIINNEINNLEESSAPDNQVEIKDIIENITSCNIFPRLAN